MPLTDEEWVAFINECDGMVDDVSRHFAVLLEAINDLRRRTEEVHDRGGVELLLRQFSIVSRLQAQRIRERLNGFLHRLNEMKGSGEL